MIIVTNLFLFSWIQLVSILLIIFAPYFIKLMSLWYIFLVGSFYRIAVASHYIPLVEFSLVIAEFIPSTWTDFLKSLPYGGMLFSALMQCRWTWSCLDLMCPDLLTTMGDFTFSEYGWWWVSEEVRRNWRRRGKGSVVGM